ncbi:MAG: hypothetical protein RL747_1458 [Bacteroidota bacterium]|jgi:hypothetical protein
MKLIKLTMDLGLLRRLCFWFGAMCLLQTGLSQSQVANAQKPFRVPLDYVAMSPVFNQENIQATQDSGIISFQKLSKLPHWRKFRRTRLKTVAFKRWVGFKDTSLDGESGMYKEVVFRISGRLITATDQGVWIYQARKKQVAYVPYQSTARIKSGSSTGRTIYLAMTPILAEIGGWVAVDAVKGVDKDRGLIYFFAILGTAGIDLALWSDYMDKKRNTPLCKLWVNGSVSQGQLFRRYAEGGRYAQAPGVVEVMFSNELHFFPRTYVRRTSVDAGNFLPSATAASAAAVQP